MTTLGDQAGHSRFRAVSALLRTPWTAGPWIATAQVLVGLPLALVASTVVLTLGAAAISLVVTAVLAVPFLAALFAAARVFTGWHRARLAALREALPAVDDPRVGPTWLRRFWADCRSAGTWRQVAYHALSGFTAPLSTVIVTAFWTLGALGATLPLYAWALPAPTLFGVAVSEPGPVVALTVLGLVTFLAAPWVAVVAAQLDLSLARALLTPSRSERLARRVDSLSRSRADAVDAADIERRRIERDLHDGTQQRLVSLAMNLGVARTTLTDVPESARGAIAQAHEEAKLALSELRDVVRGMHPAVLDDLGLDAALSGIAARSPVPVRLLVELPARPPRAVETAAYFVVSEALTNVAKHAGATRVDVVVEQTADRMLRIIVSDDGHGGADPERGSGLRGLRQRIRAIDGVLTIDSPPGGPTILVVDLPCG